MSAFNLNTERFRHDTLRHAQREAMEVMQADMVRDALRYAHRDASRYAERDVERYMLHSPGGERDRDDETANYLRQRVTARSKVFAFPAELFTLASELRRSFGPQCAIAVKIDEMAHYVGNLAHGLGDPEDYEGATQNLGPIQPVYPRDHWATAAHIHSRVTARSDLFEFTSSLTSLAIELKNEYGNISGVATANLMAEYLGKLAHGLMDVEDYEGASDVD